MTSVVEYKFWVYKTKLIFAKTWPGLIKNLKWRRWQKLGPFLQNNVDKNLSCQKMSTPKVFYLDQIFSKGNTGWCICIWTIFESGCGIQVSPATPTKFSMLFKHNYCKLSWKFGDHSLNFSFVHGPSWLRILESIHRYGVIFTFCKKISKGHCEAMLDVKKIYFIDF